MYAYASSPTGKTWICLRSRRSDWCSGRSACVKALVMGTKLLISFLTLLISAANSGAVLICAASCTLSPPVAGAVVRHHEMESQPSATNASQHTHHHGAACAECLRKAWNSLNQTSDCNSPLEIRALTEGSFSFDVPTRVAQDLPTRSADGLALCSDGRRSFLFGDCPTTRRFDPASLPLRI